MGSSLQCRCDGAACDTSRGQLEFLFCARLEYDPLSSYFVWAVCCPLAAVQLPSSLQCRFRCAMEIDSLLLSLVLLASCWLRATSKLPSSLQCNFEGASSGLLSVRDEVILALSRFARSIILPRLLAAMYSLTFAKQPRR